MAQNPKRKRKRVTPIIPLYGNTYAKGLGPDACVVSLLEEVLSRAKRGEIIGIAFAGVQAGGYTEHTWTAGRAGRHHMISAVQQLHHHFMNNNFDSAE